MLHDCFCLKRRVHGDGLSLAVSEGDLGGFHDCDSSKINKIKELVFE